MTDDQHELPLADDYDDEPDRYEPLPPADEVDFSEPDEAGDEDAPDEYTAYADTAAAHAAAYPDSGDHLAVGEEDRLRQPRAQNFRRRLRMQISMLPLAVFLIALGAYLSARAQNVGGLPDLSTPALWGVVVLAVAFTAIFHALVFGRRERGLLFFGLWVWLTAGVIAVVIVGIDDRPDAGEWWPLLLVALGLAFVVTYLVERLHDTRLVLLGVIALVAAAAAFWITHGRADTDLLDRAADYWPLLLALLGLGLLPLAFQHPTR